MKYHCTRKRMQNRQVRIPYEVSLVIQQLLNIQGRSFSDYVRSLIVSDLDRRSVFTTQLKEQMITHEEGAV